VHSVGREFDLHRGVRNLRTAVFGALTVAFVAAAVAWTVASASALSVTFDEPHHLATGIEWWQFGTYRWWTENPPLPKVLTAVGPYLAGVRLPGPPTPEPGPWDAGIKLLEDGGARTLMLARLGTIPWLLLALGLTFVLAGGRKEVRAAFVATALVATYPPLLGHAGLATTDVAAVATVLGFLLAFDRWADRPTRRRAVIVGVALAVAALCKLTALVLCAVLAVAWLCGRRAVRGRWLAAAERAPVRWRAVVAQVAIAAAAMLAVVWAGYRFSVGRLGDLPPMDYMGTPAVPPVGQRSALMAWLCRLPLPAPEFWHGFLYLRAHDAHGHLAFMFGETREHGFRSFYFVGLALKSPLTFLIFVAAAVGVVAVAVAMRRRGRGAAAVAGLGRRGAGAGLAAAAALAFSAIITVNIGLRHMLIVVPLLAIFAARALVPWIDALAPRWRAIGGAAVGLLLVVQIAVVARARPQLMAYFNPLAGREPGHALIDSDLDWGQDMLLLKRELATRRVSEVHYGLFAIVNPCEPGWPKMIPLEPRKPVTGWVVLSEQFYRSGLHFSFRRESCEAGASYPFHVDPVDAFDWLKGLEPVTRVGASVRLYYVPEQPIRVIDTTSDSENLIGRTPSPRSVLRSARRP
jgi:hypothetical protein